MYNGMNNIIIMSWTSYSATYVTCTHSHCPRYVPTYVAGAIQTSWVTSTCARQNKVPSASNQRRFDRVKRS